MWCISLYQPWAQLCVLGPKKFETRPRPPIAGAIGERIAIHAGKKRDAAKELDEDTLNEIAAAFVRNHQGVRIHWSQTDIHYGAVVGSVLLRGAYRIGLHYADHRTAAVVEKRGSVPDVSHIHTDLLGNYSTGRWAWVISDPKQFVTPHPARGNQGWWRWDHPDE